MDESSKPDSETKSDAPAPRKRDLGVDGGKVHIAEDFNAPNAEITELFEGACERTPDNTRDSYAGTLTGAFTGVDGQEYLEKERQSWEDEEAP